MRVSSSSYHIFGIRHHGPGSARSLRQALEQLQPDCILVEGPPDAMDVLPLLVHPEMQPPVSLLIYAPDQPRRAAYYPFAVFSPEWQALHYGLTHQTAVRFMDLPQAHQLALADRAQENADTHSASSETLSTESPALPPDPRGDPLQWLAEAAGYGDGERWWEHMIEQRRDSRDVFGAVLEAMSELRAQVAASKPDASRTSEREALREAYMRQGMRAARREGFARIAVVCGAWHAPALNEMPSAKADTALLKDLPKAKVQATWIPWTYGRLSTASGYGAGIHSPGWCQHLWSSAAAGHAPTEVAIHWLTRVARLLRGADLDASSAQVIDAVRLAKSLAALRNLPLPGLDEMNAAAQTVFCFGGDTPMRLVHDQLIVGEILGRIPPETPMVPLQRDLEREQKRLRLPAEATVRALDLDLRQANDLERSRLLHRLNLLGLAWGELQRMRGSKGTFHEWWKLAWKPELTVVLVEAGQWGNTIVDAATAYTRHQSLTALDLPALTQLLERALLADLPEAITTLMVRLQAETALASDVGLLMDALPPLANVMRYGNVCQTDVSMVRQVVDGLVARIGIGLPGACASLGDDAAAAMFERLTNVNSAIALLKDAEHSATWRAALARLADRQGIHGLIGGRCCRILHDGGAFSAEDTARRMSLALSAANEPPHAAAWLEGFLKGSGQLLLHDEGLWRLLDAWLSSIAADAFTALLPLLRRTFATFTAPERRQVGERARSPQASWVRSPARATDFDVVRAEQVLPLVALLLGLDKGNSYDSSHRLD